MELVKKITSKNNDVNKYVFKRDDDKIIEFSHIDKGDGKDIICVPSQTMCYMGCKFCHTTEYIGKIGVENVLYWEYVYAIKHITDSINWSNRNTQLLISFMGCGEPMNNPFNILHVAEKLQDEYKNIRFALATMLPSNAMHNFFFLTEHIKESNLNFKFHYSLHFTNDKIRKEWMPAAIDIKTGITAFNYYNLRTGNAIEVHYTLIDGVNDSIDDAKSLVKLLSNTRFSNVKFLYYNEKDNVDHKRTDNNRVLFFQDWLSNFEMASEYKVPDGEDINSSCGQFLREAEYYVPPGLDIGASCGQFNMNDYVYKD